MSLVVMRPTMIGRIVELSLIVAPPAFALTTFGRVYQPTSNLGFATAILISECVVIICAIIVRMRLGVALRSLSKITQIAVLVLLCVIAFDSFFVAKYPLFAQSIMLITILPAIFALSLTHFAKSGTDLQRFSSAIGWGACTFCITTYFLLLMVRNEPGFDWYRVGIGVSNVRQLGFYGLTAAATGAGLMTASNRSTRRSDLGRNALFIAIGTGMCFWSGGRAAAVALIMAIGLAIGMAPRFEAKRIAILILLAFAMGIALSLIWIPDENYGLTRMLFSSSDANDLNSYTSNRIEIWRETLSFIAQRPLLGHGLAQFKFVVPSAESTFNHPHNAIFQFLFQWGIVGTIAVLIMARSAFANMRYVIREKSDAAGLAAICLLVAHLSMSMLEGNLFHVYPVSVVVFALVVLATAKRG